MDDEKWVSQLAILLLPSYVTTRSPGSISCYDLRKEVSVLLTDLAGPSTHKIGFASGRYSVDDANILQHYASCFNKLFKYDAMNLIANTSRI
jgi:hypothetical protein